jgi:diguanylate cyclase (GGDEF)-like protein
MKRRTPRDTKVTDSPVAPAAVLPAGTNPSRGRDQNVLLYRQAFDLISVEATTYIDRFYSSPVPFVVLDRNNRIKDCNRALTHLLGRYSSQLRNLPFIDHIGKPCQALFLTTIRRAWERATDPQCVISLVKNDGSTVRAQLIAGIGGEQHSSIPPECRIVIREISDRAEPKTHPRDREVDSLTGTLNRREGFMALEYCIAECHKYFKPLAICLLDLNNLGWINDHFGYLEGDEAIVTTAGILSRNIKKTDVVVRVGGDAFLLILRRCNAELAELVMNRIVAELEQHNAESAKPYHISWRHDIEEWNEEDDATVDDLVKKAEGKIRRGTISGREELPPFQRWDRETPPAG